MRYASAGAFRTALERRLRTQAEQTGVPLVRLRKLVVFDRLIARLMAVAPDRWLLKGAVALPSPLEEWRYKYRRMAAEFGLDPELSAGYDRARTFLDPILEATIPGDARRDPARRTW